MPAVLPLVIGGLAAILGGRLAGQAIRDESAMRRKGEDTFLKTLEDARKEGNVEYLTLPSVVKMASSMIGKENFEALQAAGAMKKKSRSMFADFVTGLVMGEGEGERVSTPAASPTAQPFMGSSFAEAVSAMAGQPRQRPPDLGAEPFRPGQPIGTPPTMARDASGRPMPDPSVGPIIEPGLAEPAALPTARPVPAAAPQLAHEDIVNQLVSAGTRARRSATATFSQEGGAGVSVSSLSPEQRGLAILSEASKMNAPLSAVYDALERGQASVPEARMNTFRDRRMFADFDAAKKALATQVSDPQQLDKEAAREVMRMHGIPGPFKDLVFANKEESEQTTVTFFRNQLGKGLTPDQAADRAHRFGFAMSPELRKGLMQEAYRAAMGGELQKRASQGVPAEQAGEEAAQAAARLVPEGVPPELVKKAYPDRPPLPQDVEGELRIGGKTGATATGEQVESARQRAADFKAKEDLRRVEQEAQARKAIEEGKPPGGGAVPIRPAATERKEIGEADARITSVESLLDRIQKPEIRAVMGPTLTRPFAAGKRALGGYIPEALTPPQRQFFADLSRETSALKTLLIGAARTKPELADLIPLIPEPHDLPESAEPKLRALASGLRRERKALGEALAGVGVQVPPESVPPVPKGSLKKRPDGSLEYVPGGK